jgi:hypothetical protein
MQMAVSTVDGTIEAAALKRRARNISIYDSITFRRDGGSEHRLGKSVVPNEVADALKPGTKGRFYLYSSIDHKGVHGVRSADGTAVHGYSQTNERLMLIVFALNALWLVGGTLLDGQVRLFPLALVVLAVVVYPLYRKTRIESRRQFDADAGYTPQA